MVIRKATWDYDNSNKFSKHDKNTCSNTCSCCLSVFVTNRVTFSALFFLASWVTFNFFLPFEYTKWLDIYFDVIQGLLLFSMQKNSTRSGLFKRYLSVILNLQLFEVVRIALQNMDQDSYVWEMRTTNPLMCFLPLQCSARHKHFCLLTLLVSPLECLVSSLCSFLKFSSSK